MRGSILYCALAALFLIPATYAEDHHHEKDVPSEFVNSLAEGVSDKEIPFQKFGTRLKVICKELEQDGRREPIALVAEEVKKNSSDCAPCRVFAGAVLSSCRAVGTSSLDKKKAQKKSKKEPEEPTEPSETSDLPPTSNVSPPAKARYPSAMLVDLVSQLGLVLYDSENSSGDARSAITPIIEGVMGKKDLSFGAKDYYTVFFSFLTAPWEGRELKKNPKHGSGVEEISVDDFFEG